MTNTTITLTVSHDESPLRLLDAIRAAVLSLPDEPIGYSNDPFWEGTPELALPLVVDTETIGEMTITTGEPVRCFTCEKKFFTREAMIEHGREHVETVTLIPNPIVDDEESTYTCPVALCDEVFIAEGEYVSHFLAMH